MRKKSVRRWITFTSAAGAALASPQEILGAIVNINPTSVTLNSNTLLDLNGDAVNDFGLRLNTFSGGQLYQTASAYVISPVTGQLDGVSNTISGGGGSASFIVANVGVASSPGANFDNAGFGLPTNSTITLGLNLSGNQNGWIQLRLNAPSPTLAFTSLQLLGGAYESVAGTSIHVGTSAIPEPSSFAFLGLLATGAAGVTALRKYRQQIENNSD